MEQKQRISARWCLDQDTSESLSFSGLLCVQQQTKSVADAAAAPHLSSSNTETDFRFSIEKRLAHTDSSKHQMIKPVSYNNLAVLLPHCESSGRKLMSPPKRANYGGVSKDWKEDVKKKSVFKSICEPCRVCHAVEPSAIKQKNRLMNWSMTDAKYLVDVFKIGVRMCRGDAEIPVVSREEVRRCLER